MSIWRVLNLQPPSRILRRSQIVAPQAGTVLAVNRQVGELPGDDGVFLLGNLDMMEAKLEVYQTERDKITLGQVVTLTSSALAVPLSGRIGEAGFMIRSQSVMTRLLQFIIKRMPVGWLQLSHSKARLIAAVFGVTFANLLVLVQQGVIAEKLSQYPLRTLGGCRRSLHCPAATRRKSA
jgi:hypothetical protein